jgi:bifunctional DNA-binding transcriptional regulator/antitoxin component of YhaV-PrlF toxin-antitoxin module
MVSLTRGLTNKSEMMRRLHAAGYLRAEIAKFLGVRYQFVRNVVEEAERRNEAARLAPLAPTQQDVACARTATMKLRGDGSVVLPPELREGLSLKEGDKLIGILEQGEIRLLTVAGAVRLAQAIVRESVPAGTALSDELLDDRRREVAREDDRG